MLYLTLVPDIANRTFSRGRGVPFIRPKLGYEPYRALVSALRALRAVVSGPVTNGQTTGSKTCGRFTVKATWAELVALYRLTMDAAPHNLRPRYNVCPTDPVDVVAAEEGKRELITMRWGLVPRWWSKAIKDAKMVTFNARTETIETKPFFRDAFKPTRCLIPMSGYYDDTLPARRRIHSRRGSLLI